MIESVESSGRCGDGVFISDGVDTAVFEKGSADLTFRCVGFVLLKSSACFVFPGSGQVHRRPFLRQFAQ